MKSVLVLFRDSLVYGFGFVCILVSPAILLTYAAWRWFRRLRREDREYERRLRELAAWLEREGKE